MFEKLLKTHIRNDPGIAGMLASYSGMPAVFHKSAPMDTNRGWDGGSCYPRMEYFVDMAEDPERKTSGSLVIDVACALKGAVVPEDIEQRLVELLSGTFYTVGGNSFCVVWNRSDYFELSGRQSLDKKDPMLVGITVIFDINSFPLQVTTDPDPIAAMNQWTSDFQEDIVVIGCEELPNIFKPCNQNPAVYWRILSLSISERSSFAVTWYDCRMVCHLICDGIPDRTAWLKSMAQGLGIEQEVLMADFSPLFINQLHMKNSADMLREGQLTIDTTYGVLNTPHKIPAKPKLMHAYFNIGDEKYEEKPRKDHYNQSKPVQGGGIDKSFPQV